MILIILALLCTARVPLTGGRVTRLAKLQVSCLWLAPAALGLQFLIVTIAPSGNARLHAAVHVLTYAAVVLFLAANLHLPGTPLIALGTVCNVLAIVANRGVMPASAAAQRMAGLVESGGFHNSARLAHAHLPWLGDVIPVPGPLPNVLSVGDVILFTGMLVLLHRVTRESAWSDAEPPFRTLARLIKRGPRAPLPLAS